MTLDEISQLFKALSDPIRLRILNLLLRKDSFCVCEMVDILGIGQSTISRHLAYLKNSGLVESWREGVWMHYSLKKENLQCIALAQLQMQLENCEVVIKDNKNLEMGNLLCVAN